MVIPNKVVAKTTAAALTIPKKIISDARRKGTPNMNATNAPDQAPVRGRGIATNTNRATGAQPQ